MPDEGRGLRGRDAVAGQAEGVGLGCAGVQLVAPFAIRAVEEPFLLGHRDGLARDARQIEASVLRGGDALQRVIGRDAPDHADLVEPERRPASGIQRVAADLPAQQPAFGGHDIVEDETAAGEELRHQSKGPESPASERASAA